MDNNNLMHWIETSRMIVDYVVVRDLDTCRLNKQQVVITRRGSVSLAEGMPSSKLLLLLIIRGCGKWRSELEKNLALYFLSALCVHFGKVVKMRMSVCQSSVNSCARARGDFGKANFTGRLFIFGIHSRHDYLRFRKGISLTPPQRARKMACLDQYNASASFGHIATATTTESILGSFIPEKPFYFLPMLDPSIISCNYVLELPHPI